MRAAGASGVGQHSCQKRIASQAGASEQASGITKGSRNSQIHGLVDKLCHAWVLILTLGNTVDCTVMPACVSLLAGIKKLLGDKAYGGGKFRKSLRKSRHQPGDSLAGQIAKSVFVATSEPIRAGMSSSAATPGYPPAQGLRRIATRHDKLARNYFSAPCLVAAVVFWL